MHSDRSASWVPRIVTPTINATLTRKSTTAVSGHGRSVEPRETWTHEYIGGLVKHQLAAMRGTSPGSRHGQDDGPGPHSTSEERGLKRKRDEAPADKSGVVVSRGSVSGEEKNVDMLLGLKCTASACEGLHRKKEGKGPRSFYRLCMVTHNIGDQAESLRRYGFECQWILRSYDQRRIQRSRSV